jgi:hypothetical protein
MCVLSKNIWSRTGRDAPRPAEIETGLSHARATFFRVQLLARGRPGGCSDGRLMGGACSSAYWTCAMT